MLGDYCSRTLSLMRLSSSKSSSVLFTIMIPIPKTEPIAPELGFYFSAEGGKTWFPQVHPMSQGAGPKRELCCELSSLPRRHPLKRDMRAKWSEGGARGSKGLSG